MQEDVLMSKSRVNGEILSTDFELRPCILSYNFNDMKRRIIPKPYRLLVKFSPRKMWLDPEVRDEF